MFSPTGGPRISIGLWAQRIGRGPSGRVGRVLAACLAALALYAVAGSVAAYAATPTVTGVSPNNGPAAGGTTVTVTGSGFALGTSATRITFGQPEDEVEAMGVNCATTTECTATAPEVSLEGWSVADVRATVSGMESPPTLGDQFEYHGLFLTGARGRLPVGESVALRGFVSGRETGECNAFVEGSITSNGQATDEVNIRPAEFTNCLQEDFFGDLPFSVTLRLGADGSATVEGPMGVRTPGCVFEGERMGGSVELRGPLSVFLGGTFPLVEEEVPGAECPATESVFMRVGTEGFTSVERVGAALPNVTGLSPGGGPKTGGTTVTITGAGLGEASAVRFGSAEAASFQVNSPTSITAVSPAGEGTVTVTVTDPRGTSPAGVSGDKFTYGPAVSGIEPDHGPRTGGTTVTITGVNLGEASTVTFGTTPAASFTVVSPTSVTAVSPPSTGVVDVTVSTPEGSSPAGAQDRFSYDVPPPSITGISPASGPEAGGTAITVTGADLTGATAVKFGATNAISFTVNSDTSLTAVSPGGTGAVDVSVGTSRGTSTSGPSDRFTYEPAGSGLPEIGRCTKATPVKEGNRLVYHGVYETVHCTTTSGTHEGKYEWSTGPGAGGGFTGTAKVAKLETLHEVDHLGPFSRITCEGNSETGEFTGPRTAVATITFRACVDVRSKASCQSAGQPTGTVQTGPLDGELGVIKSGETPVIGIAFRPHDSTVFTNIECGTSNVTVEGAIIAPITAIDAMSTKHHLAYKGYKGAQSFTAFEGEPPETLSVGEPMSLTMPVALTGMEALEVKAIG
jgi:hypothetical protein